MSLSAVTCFQYQSSTFVKCVWFGLYELKPNVLLFPVLNWSVIHVFTSWSSSPEFFFLVLVLC